MSFQVKNREIINKWYPRSGESDFGANYVVGEKEDEDVRVFRSAEEAGMRLKAKPDGLFRKIRKQFARIF